MSGEQIVLRISGADVRNGQIPADVFASAIRKFAATMAFFERIYTDKPRRSADLNVASLGRENPMVIGLAPASRVRGYSPVPAIRWGFGQMASMPVLGAEVDPRIPVELLDNVYDLSSDENRDAIAKFAAHYEGAVIDFNGKLADSVRARRTTLISSMPPPAWYAGVSKGAIFGELRGVTDLDGEREFFVCPPSGPRRVKCVFTEKMRDQMNTLLFKMVYITGFLHYDGNSPHPTFVEAVSVSGVEEPSAHMIDMAGLFADSYYQITPTWPQ